MESKMGVKFDLTAAAAEVLSSVLFMEKSPAYAAFKEEIEKILADFNKSKRFGDSAEIDVKALVSSSEDTLVHMQRAFLIWTFNEDYGKKPQSETEYVKFLKLFVKSQEKALVEVNGGNKSIEPSRAADFIKKFTAEVSAKPDLFNSLKEFFAGYIYGFFFNYLSEQEIMKDYAEFLVCLGIMSGKISAPEAQKQKILPKMALLLNNDRFKYIGGEIPFDVIFNMIYDRLELTGVTEEEESIIKEALRGYISSNYSYNEADNLIADSVITEAVTKLNERYVCAADFTADLHKNSFDGERTFLDGDKNDMGVYTYNKLLSVIDGKCAENYDDYYNAGKAPVIEVSLGSDCKGYKYPLVAKDGDKFWFADIYKELIFPAADKAVFVKVKTDELPILDFPFVESALKTNIIRFLGGLESDGFTVRSDKKLTVEEIAHIKKSSVDDERKRMLILEKILYVISGNMDSKSYARLVDDSVFGSKLYDEYIRYRMELLFENGVESVDTKKALLDRINSIS